MISRQAAKSYIILVEIICVVAAFFGTLANGIKEAIGMAILIGVIVGAAGYAGLRMFWHDDGQDGD